VVSFVAAFQGGIWEEIASCTRSETLQAFRRGFVRLDLVLAALVLIASTPRCGGGRRSRLPAAKVHSVPPNSAPTALMGAVAEDRLEFCTWFATYFFVVKRQCPS
jgi:hypothetical protein